MTAVAFSLPTEQDEIDDLATVGITLLPGGALGIPDAQHAIDASASQLMRRISAMQQDLDRSAKACADEVNLVLARYDRLTAPLRERKARAESYVRQMAELSDFADKKSRELPWGTYGRRTVPAHVAITDAARLLSWCRLSNPDLIAIKQTESVPQRKVEQYVKSTGDVPEGCELTPAHDESFVKIAKPEEVAA